MTPQDLMSFLTARRSYRRFSQTPVPPAALDDLLQAARLASCTANSQTLKYVVVQTPQMVAATQPHLRWAAYLPPEQGAPAPSEQPTLFVAVCRDTALPGGADVDLGLAISNMTAAAWAHGVGSCVLGAIDRPALTALYRLPETLELRYLIAFGLPLHPSHVVDVQNGDIRYFLDAGRDYCVPKRPLTALVAARL